MASVRLYVSWIFPPDKPDSEDLVMKIFSGFWLENGFILVVAHFFHDDDYTIDQQNKILEQMASIKGSRCSVSSSSTSDKPGIIPLSFYKTRFIICIDLYHPDDTSVYLWQADFESDIALFRTTDSKATTHSKKYHVQSNQLISIENWIVPTTGISVWSTAYCGDDDDFTTDNGKKFLKAQRESEQKKEEILQSAHTMFGYMKNRYMEDLQMNFNTRNLHDRLVASHQNKVSLMD